MGEELFDQNIARRRFLKRAMAVAWMAPTILTVTAGRASAQIPSSVPTCTGGSRVDFCSCSSGSNCLNGCCCQHEDAPGDFCTSSAVCTGLGGTCK